MAGVNLVTVSADDGEVRLDRWFKRHYPQVTHGHLEKLLRTKQIKVDGKKALSSQRVTPGQIIRVPPLPEKDRRWDRRKSGGTALSFRIKTPRLCKVWFYTKITMFLS